MEAAENKRFVYEFGKFVLDPSGRTLYSGGDPVHLPAKEFDTLLLLVEHNGRSLSKEEMISAVWRDAFVEEGNLAKQISRLRKILSTNDIDFIETIPKHGYRFSAELRRVVDEFDTPVIAEKRTISRVTVSLEQQTEPRAFSTIERYLRSRPTIAVVVLVAAAVSAGIYFWNLPTDPAAQMRTMAVLPLHPLNSDEDAKALGLGLTDSLITKLGSLRRVIVSPTNAVASFTGEGDIVDIGRKLNVDVVLDGTIQKAEGRLRVNARLIRTATGEQIWTDKFEQTEGGIFALQDSLSASIAKALAFELSKSDSEQLARRGTENTEAYEKYLRGRFYQTQNTPDGLNRSIELYQQAVALDPNFAEAYAGLADSNVILFNFGYRTSAETVPQARQAINQALRLNPNISSVYSSLALIQFVSEKNWPAAEQSLQRAIELNPNNADAFLRYGYFLINVGRFDEALEKLSRARELNPLSSIIQANVGLTYLSARRYPEAIAQLEKVTAENPRFPLALWFLGNAYEAAGELEKSYGANLAALKIEGESDGDGFDMKLQKVKDEEGLEAANRLWFNETLNARQTGSEPISAMLIADRAATVKGREQTLYWVEKSLEEGDPVIFQIKFLGKYDFVRDDTRFQAVLNKLPF